MNPFNSKKSFTRKASLAFALGAALAPSLSFAQSNAASSNKNASAPTVSIELTLPDYLKRVEKGAPQIQIDRHDANMSAANFHETRDQFAPTLSGSYNANWNADRYTNANTNQSFKLALNKTFSETGTTLSLGTGGGFTSAPYSAPSTLSLGANSFSLSTPDPTKTSWNANVNLTFVQSILRGGPIGFMGWDTIRIAREQARLARSVYNSKTGGNLINAISAYWTYELNQKLLKLQMDSITDAQDLLAKNRQRVNVGLIDIADVYTSEVNLSQQINQRYLIERDILKNRRDLILYMGLTNLPAGKTEIVLKDSLKFQDIELDEDKLIETAKKNRKELEQAKIATEIARMALRQARSALLPKLDFTLNAGMMGYDTNNGNLADAYNSVFTNFKVGGKYMNLNAGLQFETPLDPTAYKTVVERREEAYAQALKKENLAKDQIETEIRERIWNLQYLKGVLIRTSDALGLSEQKVAELRRQFNNSKIDTTQFNIGYESLRSTQRLYYSTLVQYEVEKAALLQAQGVFLKTYGVSEIGTTGWIQ